MSHDVNFENLLNRGRELHRAGKIAEADHLYRQALVSRPNHAEALYLVGISAVALKRAAESLQFLTRAAALSPDAPHISHALGVALVTAGDAVAAEIPLRRAIAADPGNATYHYDLGVALKLQRKYDEAVESYERTLSLTPKNAFALSNIGTIRAQQSRFDEAVVAYERAVALQPNGPPFLVNLGNTLMAAARHDEALSVCQRLMELAPKFIEARFTMANALREFGRIEEALALSEELNAAELDENAYRQRLPLLHYHPAWSARAIFDVHHEWASRLMKDLGSPSVIYKNDKNPARRLRIAYVSPDFSEHVVGRNVLPIFRHHDRESFEITCYSLNARSDPVTTEIQSCVDHWYPLYELSHAAAAQLIHSHEIDILVDLALHTKGNALPIFARKPAPLQFTFAGYPGTTGLSTIDYRITDPHLDPPQADLPYAEISVYISTFWCYEGMRTDLPITELPALSNNFFTFGSLNAGCKVNDSTLALWAKTLAGIPNSKIAILFPAGKGRSRVLLAFTSAGVDESRIGFIDRGERDKYLAQFQTIDLCLDALPYNGHTTSLDAMWMGVPTLTLVGKTVVGRAGLSQLTNVRLPEFITHTPEEFIATAVRMAADPARLSAIRSTLRARMESSPLMDGKRFAREIETTYRTAWTKWCATP